MTDESSFVGVGPNGRNPDETGTMADEARLSFVHPREGDSKSPPGRKDSPNRYEDRTGGLRPPGAPCMHRAPRRATLDDSARWLGACSKSRNPDGRLSETGR
jgi:hypothetical protein